MDVISEGVEPNDEAVEETSERRGFTIKTTNLENLEPPKKIIVKVELNGKCLGKSEEISIEDEEAVLNWETFFEVSELSETVVGELVNNPLVFTVLCDSVPPKETETPQPKKGEKGKKKNSSPKSPSEKEKPGKEHSISSASRKTTKSTASKSTASSNNEVFPILGVANMDIMSLLLGQEEVEEVLFIHPITEQKGSETIAWANLVKLKVLVTVAGNFIDDISGIFSNILSFTMESLHNIMPDQNEEVEIATILPNNEVIKFKNGALLFGDSVWTSNRKKWYELKALPGNGALSLYKVPDDTTNLLNTMDYEVTKNQLLNNPRIQWNQLHRSLLNLESENKFKEKIMVYNCWPVEILITFGQSGKQHESKKKTGSVNVEKTTNHYITFLDLSRLIYPGEKTVRVTSQLYTYTQQSTKNRFELFQSIYEESVTPSDVNEVKPKSGASSKKGNMKSKGTKKEKADQIDEEVGPDDGDATLEIESKPLVDDNGEPIFIVAEIGLLKPMVQKQEPQKVLESIHKIIPKREELTPQQLSTINASKMYEDCIRSLIQRLHDEYQIFFNINETMGSTTKNFLLHLHVTGTYAKMAETMKEAVVAHVREVVRPAETWGKMKLDNQDILISIYQEMASKMYTIVNSFGDSSVEKYEPGVTCENLEYFISEALEEDDYDKAHTYFLLWLEKTGRANPQVWIEFAKYWKIKLDFEKAEECAKEAISLEPRHTNALLLYGLLSWLTEDFDTAEIFLSAVVAFNPHCMEGWVTLYIIHKQIGKQKEASVEILHAKECNNEDSPTIEDKSKFFLSWCPDMPEMDRIFLHTAAKLLKFSFPELAELALSYDLLLYGRTVNNLYYLAVCHYQQGRYTDCLVHLEEALKLQWEDEVFWALKGHSLYKLRRLNEAKEAYNTALNFQAQENPHLINLRLGNILLQEGDHKGARDCYMISCRDSPTPLSWLGLGISAFMDDDMESAELALTEANMLDCKMGRVWGYLGLVNLMNDRPILFNKCIAQALKYGFHDKALLERIDNLVKLVQPTEVE